MPFDYDANGNLTTDPSTGRTFTYDALNRLTSSTLSGVTVPLAYDPVGRLERYEPAGSGGGVRRFIYDGAEVAAEVDGNGNLVRRYVRGDGADEVLMEYNSSDWRYFYADERGSTIATADPFGTPTSIDAYDEFGQPSNNANPPYYKYTGQMWLPELGVYHYKARAYASHLGRFLQTDPIGYADSPNLYAYVLNDPINLVDPLGLACVVVGGDAENGWVLKCDSLGDPIPDGLTHRDVAGYVVVAPPGLVGGGIIQLGQPSGPAVGVGGPRGGRGRGNGVPGSDRPVVPPNRTRSACVAGYTAAGVTAILGMGVEGILLPVAIGEISVAGWTGLAVAAAPTLAVAGIALTVIATVAVGAYYYDQTHHNATANNFRRRYGVC